MHLTRWFDTTFIESTLRHTLYLPDVAAAICRRVGRQWDTHAPADTRPVLEEALLSAWLEHDRRGGSFCVVRNGCTTAVIPPASLSAGVMEDAAALASRQWSRTFTDALGSGLCFITLSTLARTTPADVRQSCSTRPSTTAAVPFILFQELADGRPALLEFSLGPIMSSTGEHLWAGCAANGRHWMVLLGDERGDREPELAPSPLACGYEGFRQSGEFTRMDNSTIHMLAVACTRPDVLDWGVIRDAAFRFAAGDHEGGEMLLTPQGLSCGACYTYANDTIFVRADRGTLFVHFNP